MNKFQVAGLSAVAVAGTFLGGCQSTPPGARSPQDQYVAPKAGMVDRADQIVTLNPTATQDQDNGLVVIRPQENGGHTATVLFYSPSKKTDVVFQAPVTAEQVASMQGAVKSTADRGFLDTNREYRLRGATPVNGTEAQHGMYVVFNLAANALTADPKATVTDALLFNVTGASTLINGTGGKFTVVVTNPTPVKSAEEAQKAMQRINGETGKATEKAADKVEDTKQVSFGGMTPALTVAVANQLVRARA